MATRFYLVRHGQTEWNRVERFRGLTDLPLNETGLEQARLLARSMTGVQAAAIYSSPLMRTMQTSEAISNGLGIPVIKHEGLKDLNFGTWQGLSLSEAQARYPELYRKWQESPEKVRFPQGERLQDVRSRVAEAIESITAKHARQSVILVSHRVICKVLICYLLGLDDSHFWQVRQDESGLTIFDITEGIPVLNLINDTCHLRDAAG